MSQNLPSRQAPIAKTKVVRKRYEAPVLEAYGTVQALTLTSQPGYYNGGDVSTYYTSVAPG